MIALIAARHPHNGPGAITGQHILTDPDGNHAFCIKGMTYIRAGKDAADLLFGHSVSFATALDPGNVIGHGLRLLGSCQLQSPLVLGGHYHKINSKDGIGPSGVHANLFTGQRRALRCDQKVYLCPTRFTDPVGLHFFH